MPLVRTLKHGVQERNLGHEPSSSYTKKNDSISTGEITYQNASTPKRARAAKLKKDGVRKRPPNAFFLFRSYIIANNVIPRGNHQNTVSIEVARLWREASEETRRYFFRKAAMAKERYDAEVCGVGMSVQFSEASSSGTAWSVTCPQSHQDNSTRCPTPALSPSSSISTLPSPAPPTPESSSSLGLPQTSPSVPPSEEKLMLYDDNCFYWAPKHLQIQTIPLPQTSTIYPTELGIAPEILSFSYPYPTLLPSEFDWSVDMSSSGLTTHLQYHPPHPDFINILDSWLPVDPYMTLSPLL